MRRSPLILLSCSAALACGDADDESAEETKDPYTCVIVQNDPYHCNCDYQDPENLGNEIVQVCELPSTTGVCCIDVSDEPINRCRCGADVPSCEEWPTLGELVAVPDCREPPS